MRHLAAVTAVALALGSGAAFAGPPGTWTRVTDPGGTNTDQVALARTADGVLQLAWLRKHGAKENLVHSAIRLDGRAAGAATTIVSGWSALTNPALLAVPGAGLRVLFAGIHSTEPTDPYVHGDVYTATAPDSGAAWTLGPGAVSASSSAYASDQIGAAAERDGTPVFTWSTTFGLDVHAGLDPAVANEVLQKACCAYSAGLATDASTGEVVLGWFSNARAAEGIYTRTIEPARGAEKYLPGSASAGRSSAVSPDQKVGLTGRIGAPGVYAAYGVGYPTWTAVNLWEHGSGRTLRVAGGKSIRHPNVAAGPGGRLWVMWQNGDRLHAARSNPGATRFGAAVSLAPPSRADPIWKLAGEGSRGPLDLLATVSTPGSLAAWHTQVLPGLNLAAARPVPVAAREGRFTVTFTVADAGDPVAGARVAVAGRVLTTTAAGRATAELARGAYRASATKAGYTPAAFAGRAR